MLLQLVGVVGLAAHDEACARRGREPEGEAEDKERRSRQGPKENRPGLLTENPALSILLFNFLCSVYTLCHIGMRVSFQTCLCVCV